MMNFLCPRCNDESLIGSEMLDHSRKDSKIPVFDLKKKRYKVVKRRINFGEAIQLKNSKKKLSVHYGQTDFKQEKVCSECRRMEGVVDAAISDGGVYSVCLECGVGIIWVSTSEYAKNARKDAKANKSEHVQLIFDSCADHG